MRLEDLVQLVNGLPDGDLENTLKDLLRVTQDAMRLRPDATACWKKRQVQRIAQHLRVVAEKRGRSDVLQKLNATPVASCSGPTATTPAPIPQSPDPAPQHPPAGQKTCVIWPYIYKNFTGSDWEPRMQWVARALQNMGYAVLRHRDMRIAIPNSYDYTGQGVCDLVIYNHAMEPDIRGNIIKASKTWYFKPTVPDNSHFTLDTLGYGPYSSVGYSKPPFDTVAQHEANGFFQNDVNRWITGNTNKWGNDFKLETIEEQDYDLVVLQTIHDTTVWGMGFGGYIEQLSTVVASMCRYGTRPIVVKLHPHSDWQSEKDKKGTPIADSIVAQMQVIAERNKKPIRVVRDKVSLHGLLPKARCCVLANSSAGWECMMHRKPIISWGYPEYHWVTYDLRHACDIGKALRLDWFNQEKQDRLLCWYLKHYCCFDEASTLRRVREMLRT